MSVSNGRTPFDVARFGIGQRVLRKEDPVLLRGEGRYTDDLTAEGQVYLAFVRSPVAHGRLTRVDTAAAMAMDGVLGAWTGDDMVAAGYRGAPHWIAFTSRDGSPHHETPRTALAQGKVRFAGEAIACVAATTPEIALDAAELVEFDIDDLPAVTDMRQAAAPDAPQLFDAIAGNTVLDYHEGDSAATEAAFARAAHVARVALDDTRIIINPMEMRACLGLHDPGTDHYTLHSQSQGVHSLRNSVAGMMNLAPEQLTVLTGNVGGSFGMRILPFPEQIVCLHAAKALGRPVKWTEERSTSFLSDNHGRANRYAAELALDAAGNFLAMRINAIGDLGAYLTGVGLITPTRNVLINACSQYRLPCIELSARCVLTNAPPVGAYRGAGRQAGNYITERLIDEAAAVSGIDRIDLRRRNQLRPGELPYAAQSGYTYDCGDFTALMDEALDVADTAGFPARRAASEAEGRLRGLGIGCYLEVTSAGIREFGGLRFEANGDVTFTTGTLDYGQGHASTFAQIIGERLGVPFEAIRLRQGNSDKLPFGGSTGGSRSTIASGTAAVRASEGVISKALQLANWALKTNANDIEFRDGLVRVASTGEGINLIALAQKLREATDLPAGLPDSLDVSLISEGSITFPNGCHVCEVEIERATGVTRVVRYTMVSDTGTVVNPLLLEAQLHGGVVQGIGQCLLERVVYDDEGQLLSGSFTDYCMPRADDVPMFTIRHHPVPTATNPLGVKGVGEAGCAGSITSVMNAVNDALSAVGIRDFGMPATPERVWRALQTGRQS